MSVTFVPYVSFLYCHFLSLALKKEMDVTLKKIARCVNHVNRAGGLDNKRPTPSLIYENYDHPCKV